MYWIAGSLPDDFAAFVASMRDAILAGLEIKVADLLFNEDTGHLTDSHLTDHGLRSAGDIVISL